MPRHTPSRQRRFHDPPRMAPHRKARAPYTDSLISCALVFHTCGRPILLASKVFASKTPLFFRCAGMNIRFGLS